MLRSEYPDMVDGPLKELLALEEQANHALQALGYRGKITSLSLERVEQLVETLSNQPSNDAHVAKNLDILTASINTIVTEFRGAISYYNLIGIHEYLNRISLGRKLEQALNQQ